MAPHKQSDADADSDSPPPLVDEGDCCQGCTSDADADSDSPPPLVGEEGAQCWQGPGSDADTDSDSPPPLVDEDGAQCWREPGSVAQQQLQPRSGLASGREDELSDSDAGSSGSWETECSDEGGRWTATAAAGDRRPIADSCRRQEDHYCSHCSCPVCMLVRALPGVLTQGSELPEAMSAVRELFVSIDDAITPPRGGRGAARGARRGGGGGGSGRDDDAAGGDAGDGGGRAGGRSGRSRGAGRAGGAYTRPRSNAVVVDMGDMRIVLPMPQLQRRGDHGSRKPQPPWPVSPHGAGSPISQAARALLQPTQGLVSGAQAAALLADSQYVAQLLTQLPGVHPGHTSVAAALAQLQQGCCKEPAWAASEDALAALIQPHRA